LLANGLRIGTAIEDIHPGDRRMAYPYHKIGGRPFFRDAGSPAYAVVNRLASEGWRHILQMSFPSDQDAVIGGSWPFGEMDFHLFASADEGSPEFVSFWA
jgi:hypothetical protein